MAGLVLLGACTPDSPSTSVAPGAARSVVPLFESLTAADLGGWAAQDLASPHIDVAPVTVRRLDRDDGTDGVLILELPYPVADGGPCRALDADGAPLEGRLRPARLVIESEFMTRHDAAAADDGDDSGMLLSLPPGAALSCEIPPLADGCRATVRVRSSGEPSRTRLAILIDGQEVHRQVATTRWGSIEFGLPASVDAREVRLACVAADGPAEDTGAAPAVGLMVKRLTVEAGRRDAWVTERYKAADLDRLERRVQDGGARLQYEPAEVSGRVRLTREHARVTESHEGEVRWSYDLYLQVGPTHVWFPSAPPSSLRIAVDDEVLPLAAALQPVGDREARQPGAHVVSWQTTRSDLHRLSLTAPEADLPAEFVLAQPAVALRMDRRRRALDESMYSEAAAACLSRWTLNGERRVGLLMPPPSDLELTVPAGPDGEIRFSVAAWSSGDAAAPLSLRVLADADAASPRVLWQRELVASGSEFEEVSLRWPAHQAATRLRFEASGEAFPLDEQGQLHRTYALLCEPRWVADDAEGGGVVVYVIDTLRADAMSLYGHDRPTTPHLEARAEEFVVFENAYSVASWTLPSTASLLTGLHPSFHGVTGHRVLPSEVTTLAERLHAAGHATAAVVANPLLTPGNLGFQQGFERFRVGFAESADLFETPAGAFQPWLEQFLDAHQGEPFFVYLHAVDPHAPYLPDEEDRARFDTGYRGPVNGGLGGPGSFVHQSRPRPAVVAHVRALYDAEIRRADAAVGALLDALERRGLDRRTALWLTSDHGEEFREHGGWQHGNRLYEEQLHVPLLFRPRADDGVPPGRLAGPVQLVDVVPTLLHLRGQGSGEADEPFTGTDLSAFLRDGKLPPERTLYFEELRYGLRGLRQGRYKLIDREDQPGAALLFDLESDPGEQRDLAAQREAQREALHESLTRFLRPYLEAGLQPAGGNDRVDVMSEAVLDKLLRVGYVR